MKCYSGFNFQNQEYIESPKEKSIVTYLKHIEGYILKHTLTHSDKSGGFAINTKFINNSEKDAEIDMLSSFAMDNLSPFQTYSAVKRAYMGGNTFG